MALPNFIGKAASGAAQILQGFDHEAFQSRLLSHCVALEFDAGTAASTEGQRILDLGTGLLARLYPRLAFVGAGRGAAALTRKLRLAAEAINPAIEANCRKEEATFGVVVRQDASTLSCPHVYIGSMGWLAFMGADPQIVGDSQNPFGAAAAACLGCANVFRFVFADQLHGAGLDKNRCLSLFDLTVDAKRPSNPALAALELSEVHLVGLGAIGNAATWVISRLPGATGTLHLIDHEEVDLGNLQRYVLTDQSHVGQDKVHLAKASLAGSTLNVLAHKSRWDAYLELRNDWSLPCVAAAVDSPADRRAIQASLPKITLNAWTQPQDLGSSRHSFIGEEACLACLYLPIRQMQNEDQIVAVALRLPIEEAKLREIRTMLHQGTPVGEEFVRHVATANGVDPTKLLEFADSSLRDFYSRTICGGVLLSLGAKDQSGGTEVPMAFQSALAGLLLAREIVMVAKGERLPTGTTVRLNLLRPLTPHIVTPAKKHPSGRCICQDTDYVNAYRKKYLPG